jgi:WD40 repeat protein
MPMNRLGPQISRRLFLGFSSVAAGSFIEDFDASAQSLSWSGVRLQFKPLKEIKNAFLLAVAPNSQICVCFTRKPTGSFTLRASANRRSLDHDPPGQNLLAVLQIDTWKEVFSSALSGEPMGFSFFLGGDALYGVTEPYSPTRKLSDRTAVVVDLRTGEIQRQAAPFTANTTYYFALWDRTLLGVRGGRELVRAEWPTLRELAAVHTDGPAGGPILTGDRRRFAQVVGQSLVCRRSDDFSLLWNRQIDDSIDMSATTAENGGPGPSLSVAHCAFSSDGSTVALGARRTNGGGVPLKFYVEVLNGKDGTAIARLPKNPGDGVVLSPDGRLLAIAELAEVGDALEPTVRVYEVPSGREVSSIIHDRVPRNRRLGATLHGSAFGFTPDGKYFITANSYKIKIWEIQRG